MPTAMESFSVQEVANAVGVPLPTTPPQGQLQTAEYVGLLSTGNGAQVTKLKGEYVSTETVALRRTALWCAVAGACGTVLGNSWK